MTSRSVATASTIQQSNDDDDLDKQAASINTLLTHLLQLLNRDTSKTWEQSYQIKDLAEQVHRLKAQLRTSLPIGDPDNPPPPRAAMTALELAQEKTADDLRAKVLHLEARLQTATEALQKEKADHWDLRYQCQDLREEVWRLTVRLSHSLAVSDWEDSPLVPKTARERALEGKVRGLERRVRELEDRAWRREGRVRYVKGEGTGRARARSM